MKSSRDLYVNGWCFLTPENLHCSARSSTRKIILHGCRKIQLNPNTFTFKLRYCIVIWLCSKNFNSTITFSQTTILVYVNLPQTIFRYVDCEEDCKKFLRIVSNFFQFQLLLYLHVSTINSEKLCDSLRSELTLS